MRDDTVIAKEKKIGSRLILATECLMISKVLMMDIKKNL